MTSIYEYAIRLLLSFAAFGAAYLIAPYVFALVRDSALRYPDLAARLRSLLTSPRLLDRIFLAVALIALVGLTAQSVHGYLTFGSYHDFMWYDFWISKSLSGGPIGEALNFRRFNLIMAALAPLYVLWNDPRILLGLQSFGLAAAAFPLYWFARRQTGRPLALVLVLAYLTSSQVQAINQPAFYEIKLSVPLLSFALYFLLRKRYLPFLACLAVSLLVKQEVAFIALGFAVFIFFIQKRYALGFTLAACGAGLALFVIELLYPALNPGRVYPQFDERYAYLGNSLGEVLWTMLTRPDIVLQHLLVPTKVGFVLSFFVPLALLPLAGIEIIAIAFPTWAYTLLSELPQQVDPTLYYQSPLVPFLFFGAAVGLRRLREIGVGSDVAKADKNRRTLAMLALLVVSAQLYLPATWLRLLDPSNFSLDPHTRLAYEIIDQIPEGAKVVTQSEFYMPLLIARKDAVTEFDMHADYRAGADWIFGDSTRTYYTLQQVPWERWRASGYFESIVERDGYFLLKRKSPGDPARVIDDGWALVGYTDKPSPFAQPIGLDFEGAVTLLGWARVPSGNVRGGDTVNVIIEWRANRDLQTRYLVLARLEDAQGHVWLQEDREPVNGLAPIDRWKQGDIVRDHYAFALPHTMPPGNYKIVIGLWDPRAGKSLLASDAQGASVGLRPTLADLRIEKYTGSIPASYIPVAQPLYVDMSEIRLFGSTSLPNESTLGDELQVGLYWRARAKPHGDYVVAVQLRDASGRVAHEQSGRPATGAYPTTLWQPGEVLLDWHDVNIPTNLPPGKYAIEIVLRDAANQTELGRARIGEISFVK